MLKLFKKTAASVSRAVSPEIAEGKIVRLGKNIGQYSVQLRSGRLLQDVNGLTTYKVGDNVLMTGSGSTRAWSIIQKTARKEAAKIIMYV